METRGIAEGMTVRSADGEKVGKVIECAADAFVVEKGLFFPKDYSIRYDAIADIREGEVYLKPGLDLGAQGSVEEGRSVTRAEALPASEQQAAPTAGAPASAVPPPVAQPAAAMGAEARDELRVPVAAEQLEAEKRERQAGEVRVHKEVVTENREVAVPVTREEVRVERVPVEGRAAPGDAAFQEGTVSVPVREEEVELRKRPVVKEEVRVSRTRRQEERRADADVRREEVRIDEAGDVERSETGDLPPGAGIGEPPKQ